MNDGRGIVYGAMLGFVVWCVIVGLLAAFVKVVSFVASVYEQDASPHLSLIEAHRGVLSDKH